MALNILSKNRALPSNLPMRIILTSSAPMSSSSSSSTPSKEVSKPKRESWASYLSWLWNGNVDPADPKDGPLKASRVNFPDYVESATGENKLLLLAYENGFLDPYCNLPTERKGAGTKDNPVKIESFINERLVGCVCEQSQNFVRYTNVYKGEPKRCQCGHWLELVEAPRFWEKIPIEDLLTIPYFREMQEDGLLDKLMSGELDRELERKQLEEHH